jgi:hypothetical protein
MMLGTRYRSGILLAIFLALAACSGSRPATDNELMNTKEQRKARVGKLFGDNAAVFGPGARKNNDSSGGGGVAVNGYLWRASLDTMSFMPLSSADPFGGVIVTDWYIPPESQNERFKVQIYILDRQLRADGLRVTVFRQVRSGSGNWIADLENAILTRARQLRIAGGSTL